MLDLEAIRALVSQGGDDDRLPVTRRWLKQALREIEAARQPRRNALGALAIDGCGHADLLP